MPHLSLPPTQIRLPGQRQAENNFHPLRQRAIKAMPMESNRAQREVSLSGSIKMTREIKFRGKRLDNGSWETGGTAPLWINTSRESWHITDKVTGYLTPVNPETVGQFTGLKDKNGVEIYEGDILQWNDDRIKVVSWFLDGWVAGNDGTSMSVADLLRKADCTVIGNIHDNPELIHQNKLLSHE